MADAEAPIACTLDGTSFKDRAAMIDVLFRRSLQSTRRDEAALHLTFSPEALADLEELARLERACCGFLTFDVRAEAHATVLTITAPNAASAEELLSPFSEAASAARRSNCGCS